MAFDVVYTIKADDAANPEVYVARGSEYDNGQRQTFERDFESSLYDYTEGTAFVGARKIHQDVAAYSIHLGNKTYKTSPFFFNALLGHNALASSNFDYNLNKINQARGLYLIIKKYDIYNQSQKQPVRQEYFIDCIIAEDLINDFDFNNCQAGHGLHL